MKWNNSHTNPPNEGQKVYYFGLHIGIGIGNYYYMERTLHAGSDNSIELCPHTFENVNFGFVDACDAPYWLPYDEKEAQGWCPIIPKEYTTGLYDEPQE